MLIYGFMKYFPLTFRWRMNNREKCAQHTSPFIGFGTHCVLHSLLHCPIHTVSTEYAPVQLQAL